MKSFTDDYIKELNIKAASESTKNATKCKIKINDLRKMAQMSALDVFLYTLTVNYDFYTNQILLNDSQEKIFLYTNALGTICRLELPGFHKELLKSFLLNTNLQEHFRLALAKLMSKKFKDMWRKEKEMLEFLSNLELLLVQSYKLHTKEEKSDVLLKDILKILEQSNNPAVSSKQEVIDLKENILQSLKIPQQTDDVMDIFPTLEDLINEPCANGFDLPHSSTVEQSVQDYLQKHLNFLKQDFLLPLKECVDTLKTKRNSPELPDNFYVFDNVLIVLNEQFLDAYRHELIFVDILGSRRNLDMEDVQMPYQLQEKLRKIKTGALLCFSTGTSFENLILATVTYTSHECMKEGYVSKILFI